MKQRDDIMSNNHAREEGDGAARHTRCIVQGARTDHEDIFGDDLGGQLGRELSAPPTVPECDGHSFLGLCLSDDEFVQLIDNL
jgi:hypothetical protein